ncbi:PKD domain-containing protein [bacterium]|nr:PKD domain-containing protein [bacterium]
MRIPASMRLFASLALCGVLVSCSANHQAATGQLSPQLPANLQSGSISFLPATQLPGLAGLPVDAAVLRTSSEKAYSFIGTDYSLDQGAGNHPVAGSDAYALDVQPGQPAWAMYSLNLPAGELPQRFRLHVSDEALVGQSGDPSAPYWVAVADFDTGRWDWFGPFSVHEADVYLPPGTQAGFLSPLRNVYCTVLGYVPAQGSAASPAIEDGLLATDGSGGNSAPEAFLTASPEKGPLGTIVNLDATQSMDPDGSIVDYAWDLDGDNLFGEPGQEAAAQGLATLSYSLPHPGRWNITVQVQDDQGAISAFAVEMTCTGWLTLDLNKSLSATNIGFSLREINGYPAAVYQQDTKLMYAVAATPYGADPGDWQHVVVEDGSNGYPGENASLANINGRPAIAWGQNPPPHDLIYSHASTPQGSSAADWQSITVDDYAGWIGDECDLEMVNGFPAIAYDDITNTGLRYAVSDDQYGASGWTVVRADNHERSGSLPSVGVFAGSPVILHNRWDEAGLKGRVSLMRSSTASGSSQFDWSELFELSDPVERLIPGNMVGQAGAVGFCYVVQHGITDTFTLEYRWLDPDTTILHGSTLGDIVLDGHVPLLCYTTAGPGIMYFTGDYKLYFALNSETDGSGAWQHEKIDNIQSWPSNHIQMDLQTINGQPCALYTDEAQQRVRYAVRFD